MGDLANWLTYKAMADAEEWFEEYDEATDAALAAGPPDDEESVLAPLQTPEVPT